MANGFSSARKKLKEKVILVVSRMSNKRGARVKPNTLIVKYVFYPKTQDND